MNQNKYPEFLSLFVNEGDFLVKVKFKGSDARIADQTMSADEINKFIDPSTGAFFNKMYFDDHLLNIYRISIDMTKKHVEITTSKV